MSEYRLNDDIQARANEFGYDSLAALDAEISQLKVLWEIAVNKGQVNSALAVNNQLLRLREFRIKFGMQLGELLDRDEANSLVTRVVAVVIAELDGVKGYEDHVEAISRKVLALQGQPYEAQV